MTVYVDTSTVLRRLLRDRAVFAGWGVWDHGYSSVLMRVEALRTLDRLRLEGSLDDRSRTALGEQLEAICSTFHMVAINEAVLARASGSFPTIVKTLDALHLATALTVAANERIEIQLLTHDGQLARAAQAVGLQTSGV